MSKSVLRDKSYTFAISVVKLSQFLQVERKEYVLSKQLLRSGTAVGALLRGAEFGQSKADFINKIYIALKEANETAYWIDLLKDTELIDDEIYVKLNKSCKELIKMLVSSLKTLKANNE
ncbi:MAG: four helix bundle protein [Chitinophagaceae bacterium]|nr:four helix bundle protein [Chitinophagaceae bacterium]MCW5905346.1 four helix bundle protein [Chitinophagaceae bacterium]